MHTIVTCMKNEGAFAVEWIAYHLSIGFDHIIVFTNDCSDETVSICQRLEQEGVVTHIPNTFPKGQSPQQYALDAATQHERVDASEWVLHIDTDEFLLVELGEGLISDLTARAQNADAIALLWRAFGSMGYRRHNGGLVHERFLKCQEKIENRPAFHKVLFRPKAFSRWTPHMPKKPRRGDKVRLIDTRAEPMPTDKLLMRGQRLTTDRAHLTWANACLHHYAIRSEDLYLMKNDRGDVHTTGFNEKYFLGSPYHRRYDRSEVFCEKILAHSARFHAVFENLMALDGIKDAVRASEDWLTERRAAFLIAGRMEKLTKALDT